MQADTGPLLGEKVFSDSLPVSAVNLGLGNNAFPQEQKPGLASTVQANVTLFQQQTFRAFLFLHRYVVCSMKNLQTSWAWPGSMQCSRIVSSMACALACPGLSSLPCCNRIRRTMLHLVSMRCSCVVSRQACALACPGLSSLPCCNRLCRSMLHLSHD